MASYILFHLMSFRLCYTTNLHSHKIYHYSLNFKLKTMAVFNVGERKLKISERFRFEWYVSDIWVKPFLTCWWSFGHLKLQFPLKSLLFSSIHWISGILSPFSRTLQIQSTNWRWQIASLIAKVAANADHHENVVKTSSFAVWTFITTESVGIYLQYNTGTPTIVHFGCLWQTQ